MTTSETVAADTDEQGMSDEDWRAFNEGHWGEFEDFTTPDGQTGRRRKWIFTDPRHPSYQGDRKDDKQETDQATKDRGRANASLVQDVLRGCGDHRGADHSVGDISDRSSVVRTAETELAESKNAQRFFVGQITKKLLGKSGNAQRFSTGRTVWFRYEMDFRDRKKGGHHVIIRRRLKWSATRYAPTIAYCFCADLTKRMVKSIKGGKFTAAAIAALENGGISHEIIKRLLERIGKGNGKRAAELTDHERSVLARIESGLAASDGRRNASAGGKRRRLDFPHTNVSNAPDGEFTEVPNVH